MDVFGIENNTKGHIMAIKTLTAKFSGIAPLVQNNPQTVDPFNAYSKLKKPLVKKRSKTDEDLMALRNIDIESRLFYDEKLGVYVPTRWVMALIAKNAYELTRISKAKIRGAVFVVGEKSKLTYDGMDTVKKIDDIVKNERFHYIRITPQRSERLAKIFPIFHKWRFEVEIEYEDKIINKSDMKRILEYGAKYGGFGDWRPGMGRALCEVA